MRAVSGNRVFQFLETRTLGGHTVVIHRERTTSKWIYSVVLLVHEVLCGIRSHRVWNARATDILSRYEVCRRAIYQISSQCIYVLLTPRVCQFVTPLLSALESFG